MRGNRVLRLSRRLRANLFGLRHLDRAIGADGSGLASRATAGVPVCVRIATRWRRGGSVAAGVPGLHECDDPACVKIAAEIGVQQHVVSGAQGDNMERMARMRRGVAANGRKRGRPRKVDDAAAAKARSLRGKGIASADIAKMMGVSRATVYRYFAKPTPATIASGTQVAGCNCDHRSSRGCAVTACASSRQLAKQLYDAQRVVDVRNERTPGTGMMSEAGVDAVKPESTREVEPVLAIDGAGVHGSSKEETCAASGSRGDVRCAVSGHRHNYAWFRAHRLGIRRPARACGPAAV